MSQYFENKDKKINNQRNLVITFKNKSYKFSTGDQIFSKDKLDYGTRLLLENFTKEQINGSILDLGCGYGAIGVILATIYPHITVDMIDITDRAVFLSKKNAKHLSNVNIYQSNVYENVTSKYNYIITNPPIRAGKEVVKKFLIDAKNYLKQDGQLWFVMRKNHGVKSMNKELEPFYDIKIIEKSKGFYIIKCAKKLLID